MLLLLLAACIQPVPPQSAAVPTKITVAALRTDFETSQVAAVPQRLDDAIFLEMAERTLQPLPVPLADLDLFGAARDADWRLEQLAALSDGELVALVNAEATFSSQLAGRYRWTVDTTIAVSPREDLSVAVIHQLHTPVFLLYHHQREDAALAEATPAIERELAIVLDEVLAR